MSVRLQFDQPLSRCYTNLDFISGRVILYLPSDSAISAITVKLESESKTRLSGVRPGSDKNVVKLEVHKLLYKVLTVFPTQDIQTAGSQFTLPAGQYEYPFRFKFPINNNCTQNVNNFRDLLGTEPYRHVKQTLPPSLSGFPGLAEIKYFVKATVVRPKLFQENLRSIIDIKFFPIEPPRPPDSHQETFARRKQQFQKYVEGKKKKNSLFKTATPDLKEGEPPAFQVDARLPSPAIITCNEPLPLRILVQKLNNSTADVYLSMLQIELIGYTVVRAHEFARTESGSWIIMSQANMNMPLQTSDGNAQSEWKLPARLWNQIPIPNNVAPTFDTCNISRRYEIEIRVGLAHGIQNDVRPELIVVPLRLQVQVFSGIAPPERLLNATAARPPRLSGTQTNLLGVHNNEPTKPLTPSSENPPPSPLMGLHHSQNDMPDDAPPSYEDAIAEDIAPVDGPRHSYSIPGDSQPVQTSNGDTKAGGLGRRLSERLFSQNSPSGPDRRISHAGTIPESENEQSSPTQDGTDPTPPSRRSTTSTPAITKKG